MKDRRTKFRLNWKEASLNYDIYLKITMVDFECSEFSTIKEISRGRE